MNYSMLKQTTALPLADPQKEVRTRQSITHVLWALHIFATQGFC